MNPLAGSMKLSLVCVAAAGTLLLAGCTSSASTSSSASPSATTASASASTEAEQSGTPIEEPTTSDAPTRSGSASTSAAGSASATTTTDGPSDDSADGVDAFCVAAADWANSPARVEFQTAIADGDTAAAKAALSDYAGATSSLGTAVPVGAPASLKSAIENLSGALANAQGQTTIGPAQAQEILSAKAPIDDYVSQTCR